MPLEATRAVMERYWDRDDLSAIAPDAVYTFMPTGAAVRVPMCVAYRVADGAIRSVNVYFMLNVALEQIAAAASRGAPREA